VRAFSSLGQTTDYERKVALLYVLYTLFFLSCIVLVGAVLLQPGKTDAGALFTSNVNSNAFGPRGTATVLSKITIAAAVVFMISALMIAMPAFNGGVSVLNGATPDTTTETPAPTNTNSDANASANSNGALVETPATDQFSNQASNTAANNNASTAANSNTAKANTAAPKSAAANK
jgi:preprotein translocase subunit SecG